VLVQPGLTLDLQHCSAIIDVTFEDVSNSREHKDCLATWRQNQEQFLWTPSPPASDLSKTDLIG
jgi:hypothetical protein